jgi:alcohol dehydrogenase
VRAVQINQYGGNEVVQINNNAEEPQITTGHLLVEVHAAGINPSDLKIREGLMKIAIKQPFPITLGGDFSGVVKQIGEDASNYSIGDEVYGQSNIVAGGSGSFAELTSPDVNCVALKPTSINHIEAAALPLTGVSAFEVIMHMQLKKDQKILIHGGAGGIGTIAIQLAKHIGAYVITTVSTEEKDFAKELGADEIIDYKTQQFETIVHDLDAVFDTVGGETYTKSFSILKPGGIIVSMLEQPNTELMAEYNVKAIAQASKVTTERLTKLAELVDHGVIKVLVDKTFTLEQTREALDYLKNNHPRGKVVIEVISN